MDSLRSENPRAFRPRSVKDTDLDLIPDWLTGIWQRLSIETPDGFADRTTRVIWLQTHSYFADIRIPADRPNFDTVTSWADLSDADLLHLARQQGFAGITQLNGSRCQWNRHLDYQPFTGQPDVGDLEWQGSLLIETGVHSAYQEEWQLLSDTSHHHLALTCDQPLAFLVAAGDHFIYAKNRSTSIPSGSSMTHLIESLEPNRSTLLSWLDCEFSYGTCVGGAIPWEIKLSTIPFRQGQSLWDLNQLEINLGSQQIMQHTDQNSDQTNHQTLAWQIQEWDPIPHAFNKS